MRCSPLIRHTVIASNIFHLLCTNDQNFAIYKIHFGFPDAAFGLFMFVFVSCTSNSFLYFKYSQLYLINEHLYLMRIRTFYFQTLVILANSTKNSSIDKYTKYWLRKAVDIFTYFIPELHRQVNRAEFQGFRQLEREIICFFAALWVFWRFGTKSERTIKSNSIT